MFPLKFLAGAMVAACLSCVPQRPASAARVVAAADAPAADGAAVPARVDDDVFLLLREAARQDDALKAEHYAERLAQHDISSYVDYYRLKPRVAAASADEIRAFLGRHAGSAIADRLRNDWLLELGRRRDWANFDQQYAQFVVDDDLQLKCYALLSRALKGHKVAEQARVLLVNPPAYGEPCSALIGALAQAGQFERADLWKQLRLAGEMNATGPARRIAAMLGASDSKAARAVDYPALVLARGVGKSGADHELYLVALGRVARTSHKLAAVALEKNLGRLTPQERAIGWGNLALAASIALAPEASDYWRKSAGAPLSNEAQRWQTRVALRNGDWAKVKASIMAMPAALRDESAWVYWLGRALQAEADGPHGAAALALYRRIADPATFYGQLAMEELGQQVSAPPPGAALTAAEVAPMAANPGLRRALRFFALRLRTEGAREWNWELRKFSERQLLAAAEFARQNDILDRMVNTSERTRVEVDYSQRFPSPHHDILHPTTQDLGLDKAWVYGLIRQESRFIMDAQSRVGAAGLMQVMPATGKFVAKKIGLTDFVHTMLSDLRTNILLGSSYMNMVLASVDGSQTLATAAYNAGPGRIRSWRRALAGPVEGAIFAETIPFHETRSYVKNVMANATNYAALFEQRPQSLKARLGSVGPKQYQSTDLP